MLIAVGETSVRSDGFGEVKFGEMDDSIKYGFEEMYFWQNVLSVKTSLWRSIPSVK
jgi:hypothetical protein